MLGYNMFAYCGNNPVNYSDDSGKSPLLTILGVSVLGASVSALTTWATGGSGKEILLSALWGGITSGLTIVSPALTTKIAIFSGINVFLQMTCDNVALEYAVAGALLTTAAAYVIPGTNDPKLDAAITATFGLGLDLGVSGTQQLISNVGQNPPYEASDVPLYISAVGGAPKNVVSMFH